MSRTSCSCHFSDAADASISCENQSVLKPRLSRYHSLSFRILQSQLLFFLPSFFSCHTTSLSSFSSSCCFCSSSFCSVLSSFLLSASPLFIGFFLSSATSLSFFVWSCSFSFFCCFLLSASPLLSFSSSVLRLFSGHLMTLQLLCLHLDHSLLLLHLCVKVFLPSF